MVTMASFTSKPILTLLVVLTALSSISNAFIPFHLKQPLIFQTPTQQTLTLTQTLTQTHSHTHSQIQPKAQQFSATSSRMTLFAKKNGKKQSGKGFGKTTTPEPSIEDTTTSETPPSGFLQSIESDSDSDSSPALNSKLNKPINLNPNMTEEERAEQILRQRFGMKTYEEEQGDIILQQKRAEAKERAEKLKKLAAIDDGSFDIFAVLPPSLVKFIDSFLKIGLGIMTALFVLGGVAICFEAYANASGNALPEFWDDFIVTTVEPNFTPALLVLLGFSVSLGVFASAQLGSASSQYQEKP